MIYERKKQLGLLDDTLVGSVYNNYVNNGNSRTDLSTAGGVNTYGGIHSKGPKGDAAKRLRHNAAMDYYKSQTHDARPKQSAWVEAKKLADKITQSSSDQNIGKAFQPKNQIDQNAQALAKKPMTSDKAYSGGSDLKLHGGDEQDQQKWWQQLAAKMGLSIFSYCPDTDIVSINNIQLDSVQFFEQLGNEGIFYVCYVNKMVDSKI